MKDEFDDLLPLWNERFLLLTKGPWLEDLVVYDLKEKILKPVTDGSFSVKGIRIMSYSLVYEGKELLIRAQAGLGLWGEDKFFRIEVSPQKMILKESVLPATHLAEPGATHMELDPQTQRILVWRDEKLGILGEGAAEPHWLVDKGRKIVQAFWVYEGSHVLFRDGSKVFLLDLAADAQTQFQEIFEVKRGSSILYLENSGKVYYLEKSTEHFCVADVVPKTHEF